MNTVRSKKKGKQYKIYVNDIYLGSIFKAVFERLGIDAPESDDEFYTFDSDSEVCAIRDLIYDRAYQKSIGYLATAEYPAGVIKNKLYMKGFSETIVEDVIAVLYESKYLDDGRFVESYTRTYIRSKSRSLIEREIQSRGVEASDYRHIIDNVYSDEGVTEDDVIKDLLEKKYKNLDLNDIRIKRRAIAFLSRHGFTYDKINNYLT